MAQYDPNKNYLWTPEDKFVITGSEFGVFLNTVRAYLNTEEAAKYQLMFKAHEVIERVLKENVENNIIKEVAPQEQDLNMDVKAEVVDSKKKTLKKA